MIALPNFAGLEIAGFTLRVSAYDAVDRVRGIGRRRFLGRVVSFASPLLCLFLNLSNYLSYTSPLKIFGRFSKRLILKGVAFFPVFVAGGVFLNHFWRWCRRCFVSSLLVLGQVFLRGNELTPPRALRLVQNRQEVPFKFLEDCPKFPLAWRTFESFENFSKDGRIGQFHARTAIGGEEETLPVELGDVAACCQALAFEQPVWIDDGHLTRLREWKDFLA